MTHNSTVDKLIEMRLRSMANHLIQQEQDPRIQICLSTNGLLCW